MKQDPDADPVAEKIQTSKDPDLDPQKHFKITVPVDRNKAAILIGIHPRRYCRHSYRYNFVVKIFVIS